MKNLYLDFEFNRVTESPVNLVSCATYDFENNVIRDWWLHNDKKAQQDLKDYLKNFTHLKGYSCVAEARSLIALGVNPLDWKWYDEFYEYRMATNHNDRLNWGEQLVDGKIKKVTKPRPKWEREEGEDATGFKAKHSLAEATFKLCGQVRDTAHKNAMRDLIISDPEEFTDEEKKAILAYGREDVVFLPQIEKSLIEEFGVIIPNFDLVQYYNEAYLRGRYAAHTAIMEDRGYPINIEATKNFSRQVPNIMFDVQREINELFPDIKPFVWNRAESKFRWDNSATIKWVEKYCADNGITNWEKTDTGKISLSMEAWTKYFDFKHTYPKDNFGAQMVRFLKLKQNLYGFSTTKDSSRKTFWDFVGSDGMVRPYTNPYGAQSSRSQPASSGFMFLKPAWMRALVEPPEGYFMAGIDYGSQEFFISALLSEDQNMIQAYLSGDVYLAFAKQCGMAPLNATKETHKFERDVCKASVLGISYLMTKYGLAIKLSSDTGKMWTEDEAQEMIDKFDESYPDFADVRAGIPEYYQDNGFLRLDDGWYMFGDNDNFRSVANFMIQGTGAAIMRRAVDNCVMAGIQIVKTNHDALYMIGKHGRDEAQIKLMAECMREAFVYYMPKNYSDTAAKIRLDPFAWGKSLGPDGDGVIEKKKKDKKGVEYSEYYMMSEDLEVPCGNLYVDERSEEEYEQFRKYFAPREEDLF